VKRLIYDVPRWHLFLHRDARMLDMASPADPPAIQFEDELFERLYGGGAEPLQGAQAGDPISSWAAGLHSACSDLPAFRRLSQETLADPFAAALAVEKIIEELKPTAPGDQPEQSNPPPADQVRRKVLQGCNQASSAIEAFREAAEGLGQIGWGSGTGAAGQWDGSAARVLAGRLRDDTRLARIAALAGRFKRIATGKLRQRVRHGVDEITDIELGDNISRLLPTELGRLTNSRQRLLFLRDLIERRCLQYLLRGPERLGKGPLVVCLDKSESMDGQKDIWATAVALALLEVAQRERRPFALVAFSSIPTYETVVRPGETLPQDALFVACAGGTEITLALRRGLEIIKENPGQLRKSDLVLITDGESDTSQAQQLKQEAAALGTSILGIGIDVAATALLPWCDEAEAVSATDQLPDGVADKLFAG
jgi:hypothetical protein